MISKPCYAVTVVVRMEAKEKEGDGHSSTPERGSNAVSSSRRLKRLGYGFLFSHPPHNHGSFSVISQAR